MTNIWMRSGATLITILILFICSGCSYAVSYQKGILGDDDIISDQQDYYYYKNRSGTIANNKLSLIFDEFYGKETIWTIEAEEDGIIELDVRVKLINGEFKVCLINSNKVVSIITENSQDELIHLEISQGKSIIAIVGNNAKGEANISINVNGSIIINPDG